MRVAVTTEERLKRTSAGRIVTAGPCGYDFWTRYLDVFEQVTVVARVERVASAEGRDVEGPGVDVAGVPAYQGPWAYLLSRSRALGILRGLALPEATVVRAPSPIGGLLLSHQGAAGVQRCGRAPRGSRRLPEPRPAGASYGRRRRAREAPPGGAARRLALGTQVTSLGQLPGPTDVLRRLRRRRRRLDDADLFVLASRIEGLPRALIEAMARALACIATRRGRDSGAAGR